MIHIYFGNGKGKTTAALGLALRAAGANKKVAFIQFMKKQIYSEHKAIKKYKLPIDFFVSQTDFYRMSGKIPTKKEFKKQLNANLKLLNKAHEIIKSKKYDLIILDEVLNVIKPSSINEILFKGVINFGSDLLDIDEVIDKLELRSKHKNDIVLTGRSEHPKLTEIADLITEMKLIKHYFDKGIQARKGIEY